MKLKMNKACDLNSISVLPPHSRKTSMMTSMPMSQQQQHQPMRSHQQQQHSQHSSFSQGISSQQQPQQNINANNNNNFNIFSQISQNSLEDNNLNADNQRFNSQERDNSVRRLSCLAPVSHPQEDSQMPLSRSSSSITRRWSSATVQDHKNQLSEELEHRISMLETSVTRFGMILDSIQADVMQVNKGTKEMLLEADGTRQRLTAHDDSLHLLNRGQEDIRTSLRSISDQLSKIAQQDKLEQILSEVSNLPEKMDTTAQKRNDELSKCLSGETQMISNAYDNKLTQILSEVSTLPEKMHSDAQKRCDELSKCLSGELQAISRSLNTSNQRMVPPTILRPKVTGGDPTHKPYFTRGGDATNISRQPPLVPKVETGGWTTVKAEQPSRPGTSCKNLKQRRTSPMVRDTKAFINLDEESDDELSCLIIDKGHGTNLTPKVDEETERILRKARMRKRKHDSRRLRPT